MNEFRAIAVVISLCFGLSGCVDDQNGSDGPTLTILTYDAFSVDEDVIKAFENLTGVKVRFLLAEDAGGALNMALLNQDDPVADLLLGIDNTFLQIALDHELFATYSSQRLDLLSDGLIPETAQGLVTPYDHGYVALNYDVSWFEEHEYSVPTTLEELTDDRYRGVVAMENPYTSSPGRAFLFATVDYFRNDENASYDHNDWWSDMASNDLIITPSWTEAYLKRYEGGYGQWEPDFIGGAHLVVSYTTSPGIEAYYENTGTRALVIDRATFHQIEYVGLLNGASNRGMAEQFIDFMLAEQFQAQLPYNQVMFPVLKGFNATLPEIYNEYAPVPEQPAELTTQELAANSEEWLRDWLEAV